AVSSRTAASGSAPRSARSRVGSGASEPWGIRPSASTSTSASPPARASSAARDFQRQPAPASTPRSPTTPRPEPQPRPASTTASAPTASDAYEGRAGMKKRRPSAGSARATRPGGGFGGGRRGPLRQGLGAEPPSEVVYPRDLVGYGKTPPDPKW